MTFLFITGLIGQKAQQHLESHLTSDLQQLLQRTKINISGQTASTTYPEELRAFACTLQFYSTRDQYFKTFLHLLMMPKLLLDCGVA